MTVDPAITREYVENQVKENTNFCRIDSIGQNNPMITMNSGIWENSRIFDISKTRNIVKRKI